jgi:DNA-binding MarR family transcriptional regulator
MQKLDDPARVADAIHAAAIRLLRTLRRSDSESGVSAPRLSALSVLVFGGAMSLKDLAAAEQVRAPTMSRLVAELEAAGLVRKRTDGVDRRSVRIEATAAGRRVMEEGRARRLAALTAAVAKLSAREREALAAAAATIRKVTDLAAQDT